MSGSSSLLSLVGTRILRNNLHSAHLTVTAFLQTIANAVFACPLECDAMSGNGFAVWTEILDSASIIVFFQSDVCTWSVYACTYLPPYRACVWASTLTSMQPIYVFLLLIYMYEIYYILFHVYNIFHLYKIHFCSFMMMVPKPVRHFGQLLIALLFLLVSSQAFVSFWKDLQLKSRLWKKGE